MILDKIHGPGDLKTLSIPQLTSLAEEIRAVIIDKVSRTGGHLGSNLGAVELTVALHYVFCSPEDKLVFDVSHQTYTHKILTGRKEFFLNPERYDEISGFSNPSESEHDFFNIGHTSTSISLACGLAKARDLRGEKSNIIAVIGDASLDGGEAYEALNYASELNSGLIVVVNDNDTSIAENHGGLCRLLTELRENNGETGANFFEALGLRYIFIRDGHSIEDLARAFEMVKDTDQPVVVHCCTQKGKGYPPAEASKEKWHWAYPFDIPTGEYLHAGIKENYGSIVGEFLENKLRRDSTITVVSAATALCIGFNDLRRTAAGDQYVDVGIAEQHAISMIAGIAQNGGKPVFATHSTFFQRAYDQIQQELCITGCPAVMIVTHGGIAGHKNVTHAGLYDIALMGNIPNLIYLAPANKQEYLAMLDWGIEQNQFPVAIRVPWNGVYYTDDAVESDYSSTQYKIVSRGSKVAILALGGFYQLGEETARLLRETAGITPTLINPRFISGIDRETLRGLEAEHVLTVTLEDGVLSGGFGSKIAQFFSCSDMKVLNCGFSTEVPNQYKIQEMLQQNRLLPEQIVEDILRIIA